jgi:hypothetical protein
MARKPNDMLEFLRRSGDDPSPARETLREIPRDRRDFLPETMMVRRSQVLVSGAIALLLAVLAFVIGLIAGSGSDNTGSAAMSAPAEVWVLRVATLKDNENNRVAAKAWRDDLRGIYGEEIFIHPLEEKGQLVLALGTWLKNPEESPEEFAAAIKLRDGIRKALDPAGNLLFEDAHFWQMTR